MVTTFNVEIRKESGFTYAKALGVEGFGHGSFAAIAALMEALSRKLSSLESAASYNSLSEPAVMDMTVLRGIFSPKEAHVDKTEYSLIHKK